MVLQSGSCQNYTALFIWLFKRRQELVGYSEAGQCQFFDRNEQISMVHIKRLWCQGTWEVRVGDFLPSLFNSFYLIRSINSSLTIKLFWPQSTWIWFYCSWPQRRRRRIKWGRDRVMDFSRREGYRTNLCRNGGEFLRSAVPSANASALFINNEEVSAVNIKKPPGSHPHKSHSLNREMCSSFIVIFFQGIVSDSYFVV